MQGIRRCLKYRTEELSGYEIKKWMGWDGMGGKRFMGPAQLLMVVVICSIN